MSKMRFLLIVNGRETKEDKLYDGYSYGNDRILMLNIIKWLID
ncbi:hypothetical protein Marpi_0736 [Marinitoga piezophila KA3]|uniref:Uncharacterized protein n=1 Tax=Marinitoga piezophila (strain DSM 14283 / JCM 11233 / KA3) TaxID=443254 RepID=H2J6I1_MARPK|nr:hypothetical protein [Marinitoga piezophila]AEX85166.1 hypothetical protein Marpi_0736 [Marinitoga piezophila KA3]